MEWSLGKSYKFIEHVLDDDTPRRSLWLLSSALLSTQILLTCLNRIVLRSILDSVSSSLYFGCTEDLTRQRILYNKRITKPGGQELSNGCKAPSASFRKA